MKRLLSAILSILMVLSITSGRIKGAERTWYEDWEEETTIEEATTFDFGYGANVAVDGSITIEAPYLYSDESFSSWSVDNDNITLTNQTSDSVTITGVNKGTAVLSFNYTYTDYEENEDGDYEEVTIEESDTMTIYITDPKVPATQYIVLEDYGGTYCDGYGEMTITGLANHNSRILYSISSSKYGVEAYMTSDTKAKVYIYCESKKACTATLYLYIDGRQFKIKLICIKPTIISDKKAVVAKGKTINFKISDDELQGAPVTYKLSNTKYFKKVTSTKYKAKKVGQATLTYTIAGVKYKKKIYSVNKKIVTAINQGYYFQKKKYKYSQSKRMKKGYADCSSFAWRCYKKAKVYLGNKSYAPTAAAIGKWGVKKGKKISISKWKNGTLLPGDLLFFSYGKNGRYKNIGHVSLYIGNGYVLEASNKDNAMVKNPDTWQGTPVLICRPVK